MHRAILGRLRAEVPVVAAPPLPARLMLTPFMPMRAAPALVALAFLAQAAAAAAQVVVAPTTVFMTDREPAATFLVSNQSGEPQEITVDFRFGFPVSDSLGGMRMEWEDEEAAARYGFDDWLHAFPRQFIVLPGQRQTVRMMARPPRDLPERVYWTRVVTTSNPRSARPEEEHRTTGTDTARAGGENVIYRLQQVTTAMFRSGAARTGLALGEPRTAMENGALVVRIPLERTGESPYLGTASLVLRDHRGTVVLEERAPLSVYFRIVHRFTLDRSELPAGAYTAHLQLVPERGDVPRQHGMSSPPITRRFEVTLP